MRLLHLYCPLRLLSFADTASNNVGGVPAAVDTRSARASVRYAKINVTLSAVDEAFAEGFLSCSCTALACTCSHQNACLNHRAQVTHERVRRVLDMQLSSLG